MRGYAKVYHCGLTILCDSQSAITPVSSWLVLMLIFCLHFTFGVHFIELASICVPISVGVISFNVSVRVVEWKGPMFKWTYIYLRERSHASRFHDLPQNSAGIFFLFLLSYVCACLQQSENMLCQKERNKSKRTSVHLWAQAQCKDSNG